MPDSIYLTVSVITFSSSDLTMTRHDLTDTSAPVVFPIDVVVGRFDPPDTSSGTDFNQQIAVLYFTGAGGRRDRR